MPRVKKEKNDRPKRAEFKPNIKSALAIINAVVFLEKTGFAGTPRNIRTCILQRSRKPDGHIFDYLQNYLSRGLELGILRKVNGNYRLGKINIRKRRKRVVAKQNAKKSTTPPRTIAENIPVERNISETVSNILPSKSSTVRVC